MNKENPTPEIVGRRPKILGVEEGANFGERQKLILDSAASLFAESGYAHTTIGDIADEMGISKPVIDQSRVLSRKVRMMDSARSGLIASR